MSRKRINVEKIREIIRLHLELKFSVRKIAEAIQISKTSVGNTLLSLSVAGYPTLSIILLGSVPNYFALALRIM